MMKNKKLTIDDIASRVDMRPPENPDEWIHYEAFMKYDFAFVVMMYVLYPLLLLPYAICAVDMYYETLYRIYWWLDYKVENPNLYSGDRELTGRQLVSSVTRLSKPEFREHYKQYAEWMLMHLVIATLVWIVITFIALKIII